MWFIYTLILIQCTCLLVWQFIIIYRYTLLAWGKYVVYLYTYFNTMYMSISLTIYYSITTLVFHYKKNKTNVCYEYEWIIIVIQ
jgi:hypothetical protein